MGQLPMAPLPRRRSGLSQITEGLGALDAEVFEAVADSPSRLLDTNHHAGADPRRPSPARSPFTAAAAGSNPAAAAIQEATRVSICVSAEVVPSTMPMSNTFLRSSADANVLTSVARVPPSCSAKV